MTELQLPNLHQTVVNTFLSIYSTSATVTTSSSFELTSSHGHARVTSMKSTIQEFGSYEVIRKVFSHIKEFRNDQVLKPSELKPLHLHKLLRAHH